MKESILGIILGLVMGLPQGLSDIPILDKGNLPSQTILIVGIFGAIGGLVFAFKTLGIGKINKNLLGVFLCFLVGTISIGIPQVVRNYEGNLVGDVTLPGLFFSVIGISMLIGGVSCAIYQYRT